MNDTDTSRLIADSIAREDAAGVTSAPPLWHKDAIKSNLFSKLIQPTLLATRLIMLTTVALMVILAAQRITTAAAERHTGKHRGAIFDYQDQLLDANHLSSETVNAGTETIIHLCNSAPTGTGSTR